MRKIILFCLLTLGLSNPATSDTLTVTVEGNMLLFGNETGFDLNGAHFVSVTTIDTDAIAYNQTAGATYNQAYYRFFNQSITFTNRPNSAPDETVTATFGSTVKTLNYNSTSLNSDGMELSNGTLGGAFNGLGMTPIDFYFDSAVYGADGFAPITTWTAEQLIVSYYDVEFMESGITQYGTSNVVLTTNITTTSVAVPMFGSPFMVMLLTGLIGLFGLYRIKAS